MSIAQAKNLATEMSLSELTELEQTAINSAGYTGEEVNVIVEARWLKARMLDGASMQESIRELGIRMRLVS